MLKAFVLFGILLIVLSAFSLVYNLVLLNTGEPAIGLSLIKLTPGDNGASTLSPVLAGIALVGGIALFGANQRKFK